MYVCLSSYVCLPVPPGLHRSWLISSLVHQFIHLYPCVGWSSGYRAGQSTERLGLESTQGQKNILFQVFWSILVPLNQLSYILNTLTVHCRREDQTAEERAGHHHSFMPMLIKMNSLTHHPEAASQARLQDFSSSSSPSSSVCHLLLVLFFSSTYVLSVLIVLSAGLGFDLFVCID